MDELTKAFIENNKTSREQKLAERVYDMALAQIKLLPEESQSKVTVEFSDQGPRVDFMELRRLLKKRIKPRYVDVSVGIVEVGSINTFLITFTYRKGK